MVTSAIIFILIAKCCLVTPMDQIETGSVSLEQVVQSLVQNVSKLQNDVVAADILQKYLTQEVGFKASLEQRLEELTNNHTALHESFIKSEAEQRKLRLILQELENNCSALQTRYSANVQEQTILKNTVENLTQSHATLQGLVTLQFVIITQFVINYKLRWIATQFVIHYKLRSEFKKMRKNGEWNKCSNKTQFEIKFHNKDFSLFLLFYFCIGISLYMVEI